jgi:hypothetical protein
MDFTEDAVVSLYQKALAEAEEKLSSLDVAEGRRPNAGGLNGWVFEQTVRYCLARELRARGHPPQMREQVPLGGRAKIDLLLGRAAIELKSRGSFGARDLKYSSYRESVEKQGWVYLYLTMQETHAPYRAATESAFGSERAFFLDTQGDWARFVGTVIALQS